MADTGSYDGMLAEVTKIPGQGGHWISVYFARPLGPGPFPGVVWLHHMPGWDEWTKEAARKLAYHGFMVAAPDLYCRAGTGAAPVEREGGRDRHVLRRFAASAAPSGSGAWRRSSPCATSTRGSTPPPGL
jgi:carboxymethylenebutenolidase